MLLKMHGLGNNNAHATQTNRSKFRTERTYSRKLGGWSSETEKSLVQYLQLQRMEEAIVKGDAVDADQLIRVGSTSKCLLRIIAPGPDPTKNFNEGHLGYLS